MNTLQESPLRRDIPKPLNDLLVIDMKRLIGLKGVVLMSLIFLATSSSLAQSIWTNPITGTNPNLSNPYTTGDVVAANLTVSGIGRGAGAVGTNANDRYNANSWNTATIDLTAYFEWTLTPDPGCEIDFTSFVYTSQRSNASIANFAFRSSVDGFSSNIGAPDFDGTTIDLSGAAYQNITGSITFRFYAWGASSSGNTFSINDFTFNGNVTCGCSGPVAQPTTETTADIATPGCTGATISWTASTTADNVIVVVSTGAIGSTPTDGTAYTASASYGSGETIGANQYVVYNGSGTSVSITGLTSGTTYNYAIFGYDGAIADCEENYLTGGNFGSFTTLSSCDQAQITSLMVNSCNGTSEGTDELIVIENGDSPINVDDMVIDLPNTTWCNSGCGGNTIVNNATYLADLNAMAGCSPDLFVYSTTIPADATIIIFTGDPPSSVLDYSANCGAPGAPIYVLFLNNTSITGNYANSGPDPKVTTIDFGNGDIETVTYIPDDVDNVDGGSVLFDDAGNPTYYTSTDCVYPLSLRFIEFDIHWKEDKTHINWSAYHLENGNHYLIEYSVDGINFFTIGELNQMPSSDELNNYNFTDQNAPNTSQVYYRISLTDIYGKKLFSLNAVVYPNLDFVFYADGVLNFNFEEMYYQNFTVNVYSVNGELIEKFYLKSSASVPFRRDGVFIIEIVETGARQKIVAF